MEAGRGRTCIAILLLLLGLVLPQAMGVVPYPEKRAGAENQPLQVQPTLLVVSPENDLLDRAIQRYTRVAYMSSGFFPLDHRNLTHPAAMPELSELRILLKDLSVPALHLWVEERYQLDVNMKNGQWVAQIEAENCYGALRGLETLSQLITPNITYYPDRTVSYWYQLMAPVSIEDAPRFPWRGLLVDTARHFMSLPDMKVVLDTMAFSKLNVFHWHVTDSQSFPFQSERYPDMAKGAFAPDAIYTAADIKEIVEYARERAIIVLPEFDMPSHTSAWGKGMPSIMTKDCHDAAEMLQIGLPETYTVVHNLLEEVVPLFGDQFFHIGADEAKYECWQRTSGRQPDVAKFLRQEGVDSTKIGQVSNYFLNRIIGMVNQLGRSAVAWEEIMYTSTSIPKDTVIIGWRAWGARDGFVKALSKGHPAVTAIQWYLDEEVPSTRHFEHFYHTNDKNLDAARKYPRLALGGEAAMWGELISAAGGRDIWMWPSSAAVGERLWSQDPAPITDLRSRMSDWVCHIQRRGGRSADVGASYCYF